MKRYNDILNFACARNFNAFWLLLCRVLRQSFIRAFPLLLITHLSRAETWLKLVDMENITRLLSVT